MGKYPVSRSLTHFQPLSTRTPNIGHFHILLNWEVQTESSCPEPWNSWGKNIDDTKQTTLSEEIECFPFCGMECFRMLSTEYLHWNYLGYKPSGLHDKPLSYFWYILKFENQWKSIQGVSFSNSTDSLCMALGMSLNLCFCFHRCKVRITFPPWTTILVKMKDRKETLQNR